MSALGEKAGGLPRPYTQGTFQHRLHEFEELIKELTLQDVEATPEERRQMITENLRFDQFCDSIRALFGGDVRNQDLKSIYRKISTNPDAKVDWSELFGYFQSEHTEDEVTVGEEVNVFTVSARRRVGDAAGDRKRRDIVVSVQFIPFMDSYLTVSQKGAISVYNNKYRLQGCIDMDESAWATGCDYLPAMRRVIACTERSLCVWDPRSKGKNQQLFSIKPIEHSPQCVCSIPYGNYALEDTVLFGDDQGCVNLLTFSAKDLAMKTSKGEKKHSQTVPVDPNKITHPIRRRKLHDDWVLRIKYFPELRCFASCSPSSTSSFVLEEMERIFDDKIDDSEIRGVSIPKGVNAFEYCARANILATGGVDKVIRVWHPHIFSRPTGKLIGHLFTIVDIACNEKDQHIISLSTARVFRIWDIHTLTSLQVFTDNEERPGEKRIYSMIFCNKHEHLLSGSSVLDAWPLTRAVQDTMQVPHTHDRPISQVIVNKELNQITTICTETVIKVWDADTGKLVYQIPDAHGSNIEVTSVALDKSGYRLASGAYDGSLKIWDFGSGQEIKWRSGKGQDEDFSVVGLQYCMLDNERCLIALGWNNHLQILLDSNDNYDLPVLKEFSDVHYITKEGTLSPVGSGNGSFSQREPLPGIGSARGSAAITNIFKKDYLLSSRELTCLSVLDSDPELLASGCTNGDIILWSIHKTSVDRVIVLEDESPTHISETESRSRKKAADKHARAVNYIGFLIHKVRKLDPAYIKSLTKHHSDQEESDEEETLTSRRRRRSRASRTTSRRNSAFSSNTLNVDIDKNLMDELTAKIEGEDAVPRKEQPDVIPEEPAGEGTEAAVEKPKEPTKEGQPTEGAKAASEMADKPSDESTSQKKTETEDEDKEKTTDVQGDTTVADSADIDPTSKMIIDTYEPVMVTCHQDSYIRFWDPFDGTLFREISAVTRRQGSAVTALCHDEDCNYLVTGDQKGYLTMWELGDFLKDPESEKSDLIKQTVCWRAHLTKIVQVAYLDSHKAILSGSTDGSVRLWWGYKGRFVGFCGQPRPFNFPQSEETANVAVLPYDISERPLAPVKKISARQKLRAQAQKFEYPLIFDNDRWKPFRRSAYIPDERPKPISIRDEEPTDKKFFQSLIKPKAYNSHLESFKTADMKHGAVFRALPVYRVRTPDKPKTPEFSFPQAEEQNMQSVLFGLQGTQKAMKVFGKLKDAPAGKAAGKKNTPRNLLAIPSSTGGANTAASGSTSIEAGSPRRR